MEQSSDIFKHQELLFVTVSCSTVSVVVSILDLRIVCAYSSWHERFIYIIHFRGFKVVTIECVLSFPNLPKLLHSSAFAGPT